MSAPHLSADVQMQFLRPAQVEARAKVCPVVYVPCGPIEWHGYHLPLGTDALKAHGVVCHAAATHGGLVYPPFYLQDGYDRDDPPDTATAVLTSLFARLKVMGFRVIIAVSGHNVQGMIDMMDAALKPVVEDGTARGLAIWEISLSDGADCSTDHAAKWETSDIMHLYPHTVDLAALGDEPIELDMSPPHGIGGHDPREFASADVGRKSVEIAGDAIGRKALELLASLPEEHRSFGLPAVEADQWWIA